MKPQPPASGRTPPLCKRAWIRHALMSLAGSAREANALIDQRTFSWTTLLTFIESAIPMGVHLTSITPDFKKGDIIITMMLVGRAGRGRHWILPTALEATGAFYDVGATVVGATEEGFDRVTIKACVSAATPREDL